MVHRSSASRSASAPSTPPAEASSETHDAVKSILNSRKCWRSIKGKEEPVWPPELEAALIEGRYRHPITTLLSCHFAFRFTPSSPPTVCGPAPRVTLTRMLTAFLRARTLQARREQEHAHPRSLPDAQQIRRRPHLRDDQGPSHAQAGRQSHPTAPGYKLGKAEYVASTLCLAHDSLLISVSFYLSAVLKAISDRHYEMMHPKRAGPSSPSSSSSSASSSSPNHSHTATPVAPSSFDYTFSQAPISPSNVYVQVLPSSAGWADQYSYPPMLVDLYSQDPRPIRMIDPTVTFSSASQTPCQAIYTVYHKGMVVHRSAAPVTITPSSVSGAQKWVYTATLVPAFWATLCETDGA